MKNKKHPHPRRPRPSRLTLYLIAEELKSHRFFNGLLKLGIDAGRFQPSLEKPIFEAVGLKDPTDEDYVSYFRIVRKRSKRIGDDSGSVKKQARKVYRELTANEV